MKPAASLSNMSYHNNVIQAFKSWKINFFNFSIFLRKTPSQKWCFQISMHRLKGNSHQKISVDNMVDDRATPEKVFGVSLAYVRSLKGSQKAG